MPTKTNAKASGSLRSTDILPFILLILYACMELLTGKDTTDVMGDQWFLISILNISSLLAFAFLPAFQGNNGSSIFRNPIIIAAGILLLLAGISITVSINKTESLVVLTRLMNAMVMLLVVGSLLRERIHLFRWLAVLLSLVLLVQSLQVIDQFFEGIKAGNTVNTVIYSLKLNTANKNILAAMIVFKLSLAIYCSNSSRSTVGRWLFALILVPAAFALFLINARASFIALILVLILNYVLILLSRPKQPSQIRSVFNYSGPALAVIISFLISVPVIKNAQKADAIDSPYGAVAPRLSSTDLTMAGSNSRIAEWKAAIDHIQHHPLLGCGIGNWKLASIPYERETVDDLSVAYHAHNDFLELSAETGIAGGLIYLAIFALAGIYAQRYLFAGKNNDHTATGIFTITALAAYAIDSIFNFPLERPVMQFYFSLAMAMALQLHFKNSALITQVRKGRWAWVFIAILLLPSVYVAYNTSRSLKLQALVNKDMNQPRPQTKWQDIIDIFPSVPNMNSFAYPIEQIKAIYLLNDKKYPEAMERIRSSEKVNPYLSLTEFLKARIFYETDMLDSARYYISKAFEMKPRARSHYDLYNMILYKQKDTQQMKNVFAVYSRYRPDAALTSDYVVNLTNLGSPTQSLMPFLDSVIKKYPGDTTLLKTKKAISTSSSNTSFYDTYNSGLDYFIKKEFDKAITAFKKAWEFEKQYLCMESIGLCYYSTKNYEEAIPYFDKVILSNQSTDGKSEFFKGACLVNLGRAKEGCTYLQNARTRNYPDAELYLNTYCK